MADKLYKTSIGYRIKNIRGSIGQTEFAKERCIMRHKQSLWLSVKTLMLAVPVLLPWNHALAQTERHGGWKMGPGMMGNWGMGWFGMIFMTIFWILLIVGMVFLIKWLIQSTRHDKTGGSGSSHAIEILKERYARGEIDKDEFESKKKDLLD